MSKNLPLRPNLSHLKHQAKRFLKEVRSRSPDAYARIRAVYPRFASLSDQTLSQTKFGLQDAHLVIAREYGFDTWDKLCQAVLLSVTRNGQTLPENRFASDLKRAIQSARQHTIRLGHQSLGTGHLLLAIIDQARHLIENLQIDPTALQTATETHLTLQPSDQKRLDKDRSQASLSFLVAIYEADIRNSRAVTCEHLFFALVRSRGDSIATRVLQSFSPDNATSTPLS